MFFLTAFAAVGTLALGATVPPAPPFPTNVIPFRTEAQPRVDPVFGDASTLRATVDKFLAVEGEMERVRDEFSTAVHETLGVLAKAPASAARACPAQTAPPYARAAAAGTRYLVLGRELQTHFRDIRRADELGDAVALTPDYRMKVKKARDVFQQLLGDYREMRVAFYDQLGVEMRHASCKPPAAAAPALPAPDPDDDAGVDDVLGDVPTTPAPAATPKPAEPVVEGPVAPAIPVAPPVWIDIDNTLCGVPTRVSVDGQPLGAVAPLKRTSMRTHAGPREICVMPESDTRTCGTAGTVRKAYLHEGWSITVHCTR